MGNDYYPNGGFFLPDEPDYTSSPSPFNHPSIRDWCFKLIEVPEELASPATIGAGPFDEEDFDEFLKLNNVTPQKIHRGTSLVVVGREQWETAVIDELLKWRQGKTLRVYSQEMFLSYWATHEDPLKSPEDVISVFRDGHPALEYISEGWPGWVSTLVPEESSGDLEPDWPKIGLLKHMGYQVGASGLPASRRRAILRNVFEANVLPKVDSPEYMRGWGDPRSAMRLLKMSNSIAAFCRSYKRRRNASSEAIQDWESDLSWLRKEFYDGRFSFEWPDW